jgi:outer membrane protein assembly factor BamD
MLMLLNRLPRTRIVAGAVLIATVALSGGCGSKNKKAPVATAADADKYLFDQGQAALKKKSWLKGREYFRMIVENYPQSRFRPEAKLGLGDTYLGENSVESLILGANEYREFLTFFPTHEKAYYAQYQLARTHYEQMLAPQRDQTQTLAAILEFETFIERFPNSPLVADGRKGLQECRDRLSDADYQVGYFYYRARWYPGALSRFRAVLKENPTYTNRDALYYHLADTYVMMGAAPEALPLLERLTKEFEKSQYLLRGQRLMASIKDGTAAEAVAREAQKRAADAQKAEAAAKKKLPAPKKGPRP